mgnify:CR=1 FL=1
MSASATWRFLDVLTSDLGAQAAGRAGDDGHLAFAVSWCLAGRSKRRPGVNPVQWYCRRGASRRASADPVALLVILVHLNRELET